MRNEITGGATPASFEPTIDYVVTKVPRFTFEKFPGANDRLTTQMKSVGEVMAIGRTFQESLQNALRGLETGIDGLTPLVTVPLSDDAMKALLAYDWPGNVRELENCLERACAFTSGPAIHVADLPSAIHGVPIHPLNGGNGKTQIMPMAELEKHTILSTIAQLNGDKLLAARMLGIGKTTLYRKLKEYVAQD